MRGIGNELNGLVMMMRWIFVARFAISGGFMSRRMRFSGKGDTRVDSVKSNKDGHVYPYLPLLGFPALRFGNCNGIRNLAILTS